MQIGSSEWRNRDPSKYLAPMRVLRRGATEAPHTRDQVSMQ